MAEFGFVYLAQGIPDIGVVKVGFSQDPPNRCVSLLKDARSDGFHFSSIHLIGVFIGGLSHEMALHKRLKRFRVKAEWYQNSPEFQREVEGLFSIPASEFSKPIPTPESKENDMIIRLCQKCGHTWAARAGSPDPKRCPAPHCRSARWKGTDTGQPIKIREPKETTYAPIED